jgi:hypothetical protein
MHTCITFLYPFNSPAQAFSPLLHHPHYPPPPTGSLALHSTHFISNFKKHVPPLSDDDSEEDEEGNSDLPNLIPFQVPQSTQQRLIIPAKPFKQWYILLEHYKPTSTTPGTPPPPSNEDTDMEDAIFTSPNIGPIAVIKKQLKQILKVHPIITFLHDPQQHSITIDLKEVPGPATVQYHGTPENRNSSWLDAAEWEPLYIIACHDFAFWGWMHGPLTTPVDRRIDDLRRCFALRTAAYQLAVEDEIPKLLQGIRDSFHSRLKVPLHATNCPLAEPTVPAPPFVSAMSLFV